MAERVFLDTNVLFYAFSDDPTAATKSAIAQEIFTEPFEISVQVLNEFASASRKKHGKDLAVIEGLVADIVEVSDVIHPVTLDVHIKGLRLAMRHGFQFYDAVLIASALKAECNIFASEDMQDGMVIEGRMTIRNPFR